MNFSMNSTINTHNRSLDDFYKQHAERIEIAKNLEKQRELAIKNVSNK